MARDWKKSLMGSTTMPLGTGGGFKFNVGHHHHNHHADGSCCHHQVGDESEEEEETVMDTEAGPSKGQSATE